MPQSTANPDFAFEVGKTYRTYDKKSSVTITKRSACYVSGVEENGETFRRKILKYAATYEYNGDGKVFECFILHEHVHASARDEAQPDESATAEITNANDNDTALASQPAAVANAESETNAQPEAATAEIAQPEITAHAEISQPDALYMDDSYSDAPGDNSYPDMDIPSEFPAFTTSNTAKTPKYKDCSYHDKSQQNAGKEFDCGYTLAKIFIRGIHIVPRPAYMDISTLLACQTPTLRGYASALGLVDYFEADRDSLIDYIIDKAQYFREQLKNPGFTVVPSEHITRPDYTVYPDTITDECPYTTVYPCDFPEITPRRNPITEAKFKWVNQFLLAVFFLCKFIIPVMAMRKNDIRRDKATPFVFSVGCKYPAHFHDKIQFITVNDRHTDKFGFSWLSVSDEDNISYNVRVKLRDDSYTELLDFNELERTCYAFEGLKPVKESNRVKYIKFEVGKSYTAKRDSFGEHREFHITVLERFSAVSCNNVKSKNKIICLKVCATDSNEQNKSVTGWIHVYVNRDIHAEEFTRLPNLILRADQPDSVQDLPAEINDITPEPKAQPKSRKHEHAQASDIEHKLIDTKDLHFHERRAALDHNAAVISSCMFHEAVISMLLKISPATIIQLGFHMGLFIAKPKGKKITIAEAFAKRLFNHRDLHSVKSASVHTSNTHQTSINAARIPDNVKFFETKHGQLAFIFTNELVFTD